MNGRIMTLRRSLGLFSLIVNSLICFVIDFSLILLLNYYPMSSVVSVSTVLDIAFPTLIIFKVWDTFKMDKVIEGIYSVMGSAINFVYTFEPLAQKSVVLGKYRKHNLFHYFILLMHISHWHLLLLLYWHLKSTCIYR